MTSRGESLEKRIGKTRDEMGLLHVVGCVEKDGQTIGDFLSHPSVSREKALFKPRELTDLAWPYKKKFKSLSESATHAANI